MTMNYLSKKCVLVVCFLSLAFSLEAQAKQGWYVSFGVGSGEAVPNIDTRGADFQYSEIEGLSLSDFDNFPNPVSGKLAVELANISLQDANILIAEEAISNAEMNLPTLREELSDLVAELGNISLSEGGLRGAKQIEIDSKESEIQIEEQALMNSRTQLALAKENLQAEFPVSYEDLEAEYPDLLQELIDQEQISRHIGFEDSLFLNLAFGFKKNSFRYELELEHGTHDIKDVDGVKADGEIIAKSLGFNLYYDFETKLDYEKMIFQQWTPFLGLGLAYHNLSLDVDGLASGLSEEDDSIFGASLMAGINIPLTERTSLDLQLKYRFPFSDAKIEQFKVDYELGSFSAKFRIQF